MFNLKNTSTKRPAVNPLKARYSSIEQTERQSIGMQRANTELNLPKNGSLPPLNLNELSTQPTGRGDIIRVSTLDSARESSSHERKKEEKLKELKRHLQRRITDVSFLTKGSEEQDEIVKTLTKHQSQPFIMRRSSMSSKAKQLLGPMFPRKRSRQSRQHSTHSSQPKEINSSQYDR